MASRNEKPLFDRSSLSKNIPYISKSAYFNDGSTNANTKTAKKSNHSPLMNKVCTIVNKVRVSLNIYNSLIDNNGAYSDAK